jgi:UDP-N-acetylglucosamine 2-epimerase
MAPVIKELERHPDQIRVIRISTGQHKEMLEQVLRVFDVTPDYDLQLMTDRQTLTDLTTRALGALVPVLEAEQPDLVIAQGDTTTTFVASLAAFYAKAKFLHVEAGLRTDNKWNPFPEEMNRRLTGRLTDFHCAPTELSATNLRAEGVDPTTIRVTGNTVVDALHLVVAQDYVFEDAAVQAFVDTPGRVVLVTAHRRENWGEPMQHICEAILDMVTTHADVRVIFPMHKNPVVRETVVPILGGHPRILLTEPQEYFPFIHLMRRSTFVLTDSGGAQEEAPGLGKPVVILRETTERPEGVHTGNAVLVGTDKTKIAAAVNGLLSDEAVYAKMSQAVSPYGNGDAAVQIRSWILEAFETNDGK